MAHIIQTFTTEFPQTTNKIRFNLWQKEDGGQWVDVFLNGQIYKSCQLPNIRMFHPKTLENWAKGFIYAECLLQGIEPPELTASA